MPWFLHICKKILFIDMLCNHIFFHCQCSLDILSIFILQKFYLNCSNEKERGKKAAVIWSRSKSPQENIKKKIKIVSLSISFHIYYYFLWFFSLILFILLFLFSFVFFFCALSKSTQFQSNNNIYLSSLYSNIWYLHTAINTHSQSYINTL